MIPHLLYLPVRAPSAPPASVLKCGVSPRAPGATERPSLGEVVLRPLTAPSRLLSPRLGDLSARHASATAAWRSVNIKYSILQLHVLCIYIQVRLTGSQYSPVIGPSSSSKSIRTPRPFPLLTPHPPPRHRDIGTTP